MAVQLPSRGVSLELGLENEKWDSVQRAEDRVLRARPAKGGQQTV